MSQIGITIHTRRDLSHLTLESRAANITESLWRILDLAYDVQDAHTSDRLCDLGFRDDRLDRLGRSVQERFPFFPYADIRRAITISDLVRLISERVGV